MKWITLLPTILDIISTMVKIAETYFGSKTGAQKKEWVESSISKAFSLMSTVSTGGQQETWKEIEEAYNASKDWISGIIDFFAGLHFPH